MSDEGPPVPDDLKALGWRTKQSRGHPGHYYYYNHNTKETFWKLSQAYAAVELQKRKEKNSKMKSASCVKDTLRLFCIGLVVLGLASSFFISNVCYHDDLNVFNMSMVVISGFVVVVHMVMVPDGGADDGSCHLADNSGWLAVYVPIAFVVWIYETVLFVFAWVIQGGEPVEVAAGGFDGQFGLTPTFRDAVTDKGALIVALGVMLNLLQISACWLAYSRRGQLVGLDEDSGDDTYAVEAQRLKKSAGNTSDWAKTANPGPAQNDESDRLMTMYDSLFRQYGIDPPEHILDNDSVSSSDTITTNTMDQMSVGSRPSHKSSRGGR